MSRTLALTLALASVPSIARAQSDLAAPAARVATAADAANTTVLPPIEFVSPLRGNRDMPRVRAGVAGEVELGYVRALTPYSSDGVFGSLDLAIDLGMQLGDEFALYGRLEFGTAGVIYHGAVYGIFEWTPVSAISIASGVGYEGAASWGGGINSVSAPLIFGLNLGHRPSGRTGRTVVRIMLEAAGDYLYERNGYGAHVAFMVGFARM